MWFESGRAIYDVELFHSDIGPKAKPLSPELGEGGWLRLEGGLMGGLAG